MARSLTALVSLATSALVVLGAAPSTAEEPSSRESLPTIEAETLKAHLEFLADDLLEGRDTGTDEYAIAARYVAAQFRRLGLEPAGDPGSYLQSVTYQATGIDPESVSFELRTTSGRAELEWQEEYFVSGDPTATETVIEGEVVFVGWGIDAPDLGVRSFDGIDLEGKIVVALTGAPPTFPGDERAHHSSRTTKKLAVAERGGVALLWIPSRHDEERRAWERRSRRAGRPSFDWIGPDGGNGSLPGGLRTVGYVDQKAGERFFAEPGRLAELLDLADSDPEALPSLSLESSATLRFASTHEQVESPNVLARLPGSDPILRDEAVVYTAHLDHVGIGREVDGDTIYNGAYDNAMGTAITLAVAEAMTELEVAPRRSVVFLLVGGEEKGLLGSSYFTHHPTIPIENIVADVNVDMPLLLAPGLDQIIAFGAEHSTLEGPVAAAARATGFTLVPDPRPEQVLFVRSDQYSFVRKGIPAVYLVPGAHSTDPEIDGDALVEAFVEDHYHRPSDDLGQPVDWPSAVRFSEANLRLGLLIADETERPTWREGDFFGRTFAAPSP